MKKLLSLKILLILVLLQTVTGCCKQEEIPDLTLQLHSSSAKDRNDAALALARCGAKAERAVPRLGRLLYDENVGVQSAAAYALRKIDTPAAREIMDHAEGNRGK